MWIVKPTVAHRKSQSSTVWPIPDQSAKCKKNSNTTVLVQLKRCCTFLVASESSDDGVKKRKTVPATTKNIGISMLQELGQEGQTHRVT